MIRNGEEAFLVTTCIRCGHQNEACEWWMSLVAGERKLHTLSSLEHSSVRPLRLTIRAQAAVCEVSAVLSLPKAGQATLLPGWLHPPPYRQEPLTIAERDGWRRSVFQCEAL